MVGVQRLEQQQNVRGLNFDLRWWNVHRKPKLPMWMTCKHGLSDYDLCQVGELSAQELNNLMTIVANPRHFKISYWFLNRQKDYKDG
ncbi:Ribosomal protein S13 [Corchorus olitorius]|uniref:Ribosomal protein S13 n=1 Tax=Corchorus olitorius TaxID=93759 RepID=A0A1R3GL32_9ROSI|nr:Ribosomal protein S13 [Corchorus olitorius]